MTDTTNLIQLPDSPGSWPITQIVSSCRSIYENHDEIIGRMTIESATEAARRAKAIEKYLTAKEHKEDARYAARVLEAAVGAALGSVTNGQRTDLEPSQQSEGCQIPRMERARYRAMNEYRDVWLSDESLKKTGGARNRILNEIKAAKEKTSPAPESPTATTDDLYRLVNKGYKFSTIMADPPWIYGNQGTRAATSNHYGGMTVDELCGLPIEQLAADDAFLHLWTTNAFLFECERIMKAWGFEYRSVYVWVKPQMGIGNYWRVSHEFMLLGRRGNAKWQDRALKSWGEYDRRRHSAKPEQVRQLIERGYPGPNLELFGRRPVNGWVVWGNEIEKSIFDEAVQHVA